MQVMACAPPLSGTSLPAAGRHDRSIPSDAAPAEILDPESERKSARIFHLEPVREDVYVDMGRVVIVVRGRDPVEPFCQKSPGLSGLASAKGIRRTAARNCNASKG